MKQQQGFSLVEVLVAISVLSIVLVGISAIPALTLGRSTDARTYAVNVAREVIDTYRASWLNQATFMAGTAPASPASTDLQYGCVVGTPTVSSHAIQASNGTLISTTSTTPKIRKVKVTVTCLNSVSVTLSTFIGDPNFAGS
jgi:prepilin-type N-terminal cleavage/methylation domain-containing protein